jgi:hypothetical protein
MHIEAELRVSQITRTPGSHDYLKVEMTGLWKHNADGNTECFRMTMHTIIPEDHPLFPAFSDKFLVRFEKIVEAS